jgi:hypothetical protein
MRRLQLGALATVVPALLASLVLVGCGGKEEKGTDNKPPSASGKPSPGAAAMTKGIEGGTGTLKGKVELEGTPPDIKAMTEELLKAIKMKTDDAKYCLMSPEDQRTAQEWRIGDNKGVGNIFVWLEPADASEFFKIDEKQLAAVPKEVVMDQPYCAFVPHCVILFPKYRDPKNPKKLLETGQKFVAKNDATISHNTKMDGGAVNSEPNKILAAKTSHKPVVFTPSKEPIDISCGIHPWMRAYARVYDHPYTALTVVGKDAKDGQFGTYEIKNVPQGKVRVIAWHPKAGYLNGPKGEEIELKGGENTKDFKISAK